MNFSHNLSDKNTWELVPLKILQEPSDNAKCVLNRYWFVNDSEEVVFYKHSGHYSLQCNSNIKLMNDAEYFPGCHVEFFKVLFVPQKFYE